MFQAATDKWDFYCMESLNNCMFPDRTQSLSRDLLAHCNQPKPADEKNKHGRGKREEGKRFLMAGKQGLMNKMDLM